MIRRSRYAKQKTDKRGQIKEAISISERPAEADDRAVPGHWEGDLIAGSNMSFVATLVERHSRYVMLVKVPNKETVTVVNALIKHSKKRLLRQYFPKGTDLSVHSQAKLNAVARSLNERPRKTLEYETPAERFSQCVATTD